MSVDAASATDTSGARLLLAGRARRAGRAQPRALRQRPRPGERPLDHARLQGHDHDEGVAGDAGRCSRSPRSRRWVYGKLPLGAAPGWIGELHRISGRLAFLLTLPVAYHCLYQLAFQDSTTRVLAALDPRVRVLRRLRRQGRDRALPKLPGLALPLAGGLLFSAPRRRLADERPVVHQREWLPLALTPLRAGRPRPRAADLADRRVRDRRPARRPRADRGATRHGRRRRRRDPRGELRRGERRVFASAGCGSCHTLAAAGRHRRDRPEPRRARSPTPPPSPPS